MRTMNDELKKYINNLILKIHTFSYYMCTITKYSYLTIEISIFKSNI